VVGDIGLPTWCSLYPPEGGHPSKYQPGPTSINFADQTNAVDLCATAHVADQKASVCTIVNLRHWVSLAPLFGSVYVMLCSYDDLSYTICTVLRGRCCVIQHSCCNTTKTINNNNNNNNNSNNNTKFVKRRVAVASEALANRTVKKHRRRRTNVSIILSCQLSTKFVDLKSRAWWDVEWTRSLEYHWVQCAIRDDRFPAHACLLWTKTALPDARDHIVYTVWANPLTTTNFISRCVCCFDSTNSQANGENNVSPPMALDGTIVSRSNSYRKQKLVEQLSATTCYVSK